MAQNSSAGGSSKPEEQFKDIARTAAQRAALRIAEEAKRKEQLMLEHKARFEKGASALKECVLPLLKQAELAFRSERVPVEIIENFEAGSEPQANVVFECCGPFYSDSYGAIDLASSDRAIFFHDGTNFHVGIAKSYSSSPSGRFCIEGELQPVVLAAVEQVVESFFRAVEMRCRYSG